MRFTDQETEWLLGQIEQEDIKAQLQANAPRVLERDSAGNPVKVAQGRHVGDGNFKIVAAEITTRYLQRFSSPFIAEERASFLLRKKAMKANGLPCSRQAAETEDHFKLRVCQEGDASIGKRIYRWIVAHSPNKVKRSSYAKMPDAPAPTASSSHRYTPYQVFKASPPIASSSGSNIGEWNQRLKSAFDLRSPEELQQLQEQADALNKLPYQLPAELAEVARQEKARTLDHKVLSQLVHWGEQTGFTGFVVMGGYGQDGTVRTFTANNAVTRENKTFSQHICERFGMSEQQWQTEIDLYFQMVYNNCTPALVPAAVEDDPPVEVPVDTQNPVNNTPPAPPTPASPTPPLHATEADTALLDQVLQALVLPPYPRALQATEVTAAQSLPNSPSPAPSPVSTPVPVSPVAQHGVSPSGAAHDVPDVHSPSVPSIALAASEIGQNQVSKSGRMIKRRVAGTAAYDNVVSRQKAASRRNRK